MTVNIFRRLVELLPRDQLLVGTVVAHHSDGTSTIGLPGGGTLRARGVDVAVGLQAFVRSGVIEGEAPALPTVTIEV